MIFYNFGSRIGLYRTLDGVTNLKQKLCLFTTLKNWTREEGTSFYLG